MVARLYSTSKKLRLTDRNWALLKVCWLVTNAHFSNTKCLVDDFSSKQSMLEQGAQVLFGALTRQTQFWWTTLEYNAFSELRANKWLLKSYTNTMPAQSAWLAPIIFVYQQKTSFEATFLFVLWNNFPAIYSTVTFLLWGEIVEERKKKQLSSRWFKDLWKRPFISSSRAVISFAPKGLSNRLVTPRRPRLFITAVINWNSYGLTDRVKTRPTSS